MSNKKMFHVISPPGSGNTFAEILISEYIKDSMYESVHHNYDSFDKNTYNVSILRSPHAAIASSAELELNKALTTPDDKENARVMNEIKYNTKRVLYPMFQRGIDDYMEFLESLQKQNNVFISTFEFLTETPEMFLHQICKKFNLELNDKNTENIKDNVIEKMKQDPQLKKRIPKDATPLRNLINNQVWSHPPIQDSKIYYKYLEYKKEIEQEQNNG
jgi:hypothetical protein